MKEVLWIRDLLAELGFPQEDMPTTIYEDNQAAIHMSQNQSAIGRTKHIQTRLHFVRDQVDTKAIVVKYIKTGGNIADALTKSLPETTYKIFTSKLVAGSILRGRVGAQCSLSGKYPDVVPEPKRESPTGDVYKRERVSTERVSTATVDDDYWRQKVSSRTYADVLAGTVDLAADSS